MADRVALSADCSRCSGLCCVALPFSRGAGFAEDKPADEPCRHLDPRFRCRIHPVLATTGWRGCVVYDCFGAGQQVSQVTYAGRTWRDLGADAGEMFEVFAIVRALHEMRFLLGDPACAASSYAVPAAALDTELADLADRPPGRLLGADLAGLRTRAGDLFAQVAAERGGPSHRGALLMAADLRGADLTDADLLGADLRDADVRGADLSGALFLTQPQLSAAHGDGDTRIPARLTRPSPWT